MKFKILLLAAVAIPAIGQVVAAEGAHLFILSGQSNMTPSLANSFIQSVEQVFGKDKVLAFSVGRPSQSIKMWHKAWQPPEGMQDPSPDKNGSLYEELINSVKRLVKDRPIEDVTYIWMQGEADAESSWGSVYEKSFKGVLEQLKQDLNVPKVNYVVGRINDFWLPSNGRPDGDLVRATLVKLGEAGPNAAWIGTDDLNTGVNPWGGYDECDGHFSPQGYRVIGQRFARKACLLIDPKMKIDESIFREAFFDSADDVKTHTAIGKSLSGKSTEITAGGKKAGLEVLVDGKFGSPNAIETGWVAFPADDSAVELIVDLGDKVTLDSVGINLLVRPGEAAFPKKIVFSTSEDGETYKIYNSRHNAVSFTREKRSQAAFLEEKKARGVLVLTDHGQTSARYVKIEVATASERLLVDEVIVNPQTAEMAAATSGANR